MFLGSQAIPNMQGGTEYIQTICKALQYLQKEQVYQGNISSLPLISTIILKQKSIIELCGNWQNIKCKINGHLENEY